MKKTKKGLAMLLALAMVLSLFAGIAQASPGNVMIGAATATVLPDANITPGQIVIATGAQPAVAAAGTITEVRVTLPAGVATWVADPADDQVITVPPDGTTPAPVDGGFARADENRTAVFTVTVDPPAPAPVTSIRFNGGAITVGAAFRGALDATVVVTNTRVVEGVTFTNWTQTATVRIANVVAVGTTASVADATTVGRGAARQALGRIVITETIAGTFSLNETIILTAPAGVTFAAAGTATATPGPQSLTVAPTSANIITATVTQPVADITGITTVTFSGILINVIDDRTVVADGPINIAIGGTAVTPVTPATVAPATVGVVGAVTVGRVDPAAAIPTVTAGRLAQVVAPIRMTETVPGAFAANRLVTFALPVGFTWNAATVGLVPAPAWAADTLPSVSADGRTLSYWTTHTTTSVVDHFELESITINTHITAPTGDIVVTVGGNSGAVGTVVVGTLRRPVTVVAPTTPNVRVDAINQALSDLIITEATPGSLLAPGTITITAPAGFTFVGTPAVAATVPAGGTLPTFTAITGMNSNILTIPVATVSTVHPSTVTVSGLRVTLDHRVPVGPLTVTVAGTALLEAPVLTGVLVNAGWAGPAVASPRTEANDAAVTAAANTAVGTEVARVALANVISATATRSVFTVDATTYTVDGVSRDLGVAARIVAGRTMLPLRAAANAVGVTNDNILFDAGVITLFRGDRIVQLRLGSNVMLVNGVAMTMETAPVLVSGRTLLPVRWIARALGAEVTWDPAARTATITTR